MRLTEVLAVLWTVVTAFLTLFDIVAVPWFWVITPLCTVLVTMTVQYITFCYKGPKVIFVSEKQMLVVKEKLGGQKDV